MSQVLRWLFAGAVLSLVAMPAYADVTDAMREIQRKGSARIVMRMRTQEAGQLWAAQSAPRQRAAVAAVNDKFVPKLRAARIEGIRTFSTLPFVAATVTREQLLGLAESPDVESIFLVQIERKLDVEYPKLTSSTASVDVSDAWAAGFDGSGYAVAVIDGGFNTSHPMLAGKIVGAACYSNNVYGTSQCPSGVAPEISAGAASNCPAGSTRCDHGTHVASIAMGNDGTNFGIARGAKLVPIDVYSTDTNPDDCDGAPSCEVTNPLAILDALDYVNEQAVALNIAAVNISSGGDPVSGYCDDDIRKSVIDMLRAKGIAVTISAGNNGVTGKISKPACVSSAESVGASSDGTDIALSSNFANTLDFVAPGVNVTAAGSSATFLTKSGTSMAAPFVAGAWTLMRQAMPMVSFDTIETALKQTGLPTTRINSGFTVPKIQIMAAISHAQGRDRRIFNNVFSSTFRALGDSYVRFANPSAADGTVTVTLRDAETGNAVGTWTSPTIPAHATQQYDLGHIQKEMIAAQTQTGTPVYFNLEVASTFTGYVQHVVWSPASGVLSNLTSCAANYATDESFLPYVFSSRIQDYVSRLRMVNTSLGTDSPLLAIYDQATGAELVRWQGPEVPAGGTVEVTMPGIESLTAILSHRPADVGVLFNVKVLRFNGHVQHVLEGRQVGALFDMTAKCDLVATPATPATAVTSVK